jgi:hypothetical protein
MFRKRWTAIVTLAGLLVAMLAAAPNAVYASENGRKNTALALGAAAIYSLVTHKTTQGLILGAGTYYAYKRYQDARSANRHRRLNAARYRAARYARSYR